MAQFYAGVQGHRGAATRLGTKDSGATAFVQGWDTGVYVEAFHTDGKDVLHVYKTGGSNKSINSTKQLIAIITEDQLEMVQ